MRDGNSVRFMLNNPEAGQDAIPYLSARLGAAVGHGGTFDFQRQENPVTGFTQFPQFLNISNVNVGLFVQQAGLTLEETLHLAGKFAGVLSGNAKPDQPYGLDPETARYITVGFNLGQSGVFDRPAPR